MFKKMNLLFYFHYPNFFSVGPRRGILCKRLIPGISTDSVHTPYRYFQVSLYNCGRLVFFIIFLDKDFFFVRPLYSSSFLFIFLFIFSAFQVNHEYLLFFRKFVNETVCPLFSFCPFLLKFI